MSSDAIKITVKWTETGPDDFVSFQMERRHFDVLEPTVAHMMEMQHYN